MGFCGVLVMFSSFFRKKQAGKLKCLSLGQPHDLSLVGPTLAQALEQRQEDEDPFLPLCRNQHPQARGTRPPKHLLEAVFFINTVPNFPGIRPLVASVAFWIQE